ncbi:MAG: hypothetical protein JW776_14415 [Candidatus Lokiarchaeota archaeon]|nr:hypothetical protein [Candidatus Lokiarchaeota archaeon]
METEVPPFNESQFKFEDLLQGLKHNECPYCHQTKLSYDVQDDSIYVECACGNFKVSAFRDKFNGALLLYYLNESMIGCVDERNLYELQTVLYRNRTIRKRLFTLDLQKQIM